MFCEVTSVFPLICNGSIGGSSILGARGRDRTNVTSSVDSSTRFFEDVLLEFFMC
jgi:hypothetical protein